MKKIIYIIIIAFVSSSVFSSCTEENVEPQTESDNGGGSGSTGKIGQAITISPFLILIYDSSPKIEQIMKTKTLILLAVVAVVTLSFTFAAKKNEPKATVASENANEPIGGFVSEDKF